MLALIALATAATLRAQCSNSWLPVAPPGPNDAIYTMTPWDPDGPGPQPTVIVVGGRFTAIGAMPAVGVAAYDPVLGTWSALPGLAPFAIVNALAVMANGDLVAAGAGVVSRWTGSGWTPLGVGAPSGVLCLLPLPNGDLVAGTGNNSLAVARWNGATWSPMPGLSPFSILAMSVRSLALMTNGDVVAGGLFACSGGQNLARWNGTGWAPMNPSIGIDEAIQATVALPDNRLVVATQNYVLEWNGAAWTVLAALNNAMPYTFVLSVAPNGDLIAGGNSYVGVARWNGSLWSTFGTGLASGACAFANLPNGDLLVGGVFPNPGGTGSPYIARVTTSCPATVATYGAGCAGTGGLNTISAETLPWIGSTFRARAIGMPPLAFVLSVYGFTPLSIPFASVFPQGLPGCTILMNGDLIDVLLPSGGAVSTQIALPDAPSLVGMQFHHYVVPFEVDPALNLTAITSSNALTCTVGAF